MGELPQLLLPLLNRLGGLSLKFNDKSQGSCVQSIQQLHLFFVLRSFCMQFLFVIW